VEYKRHAKNFFLTTARIFISWIFNFAFILQVKAKESTSRKERLSDSSWLLLKFLRTVSEKQAANHSTG